MVICTPQTFHSGYDDQGPGNRKELVGGCRGIASRRDSYDLVGLFAVAISWAGLAGPCPGG